MSRSKKVIRNIIILILLFFLFHQHLGLYLTPLAAHKSSERGINYGPSKVVYVEDYADNYDKGKYLLCKYDKWVSCNTVNRTLFFFGDMEIRQQDLRMIKANLLIILGLHPRLITNFMVL